MELFQLVGVSELCPPHLVEWPDGVLARIPKDRFWYFVCQVSLLDRFDVFVELVLGALWVRTTRDFHLRFMALLTQLNWCGMRYRAALLTWRRKSPTLPLAKFNIPCNTSRILCFPYRLLLFLFWVTSCYLSPHKFALSSKSLRIQVTPCLYQMESPVQYLYI